MYVWVFKCGPSLMKGSNHLRGICRKALLGTYPCPQDKSLSNMLVGWDGLVPIPTADIRNIKS